MESQPQSGVKTRLALLSELPGGARGAVHRLAGGHSFVDRLVTLGFTVGAENPPRYGLRSPARKVDRRWEKAPRT